VQGASSRKVSINYMIRFLIFLIANCLICNDHLSSVQIFISMPRRCALFAIVCIWIIHGCYCCIELTVSSGYIYRCFRFVLPLPNRNRHVPVRNIPFPISHNTGFIFPSDLPIPVPGQKIQEQEWLRHFPDRARPFSSLGTCVLGVDRAQ